MSQVGMNKSISIRKFRRIIKRLPSDPPVDDPNVWYRTQKEHWLGWLANYHTPGAYGRKVDRNRDARYAYNHVVNFQMLLWLIEASGFDDSVIQLVQRASEGPTTMQAKSAAIRRIVTWDDIEQILWR